MMGWRRRRLRIISGWMMAPVARVFRTPHRYIWLSELDLMAQIASFERESREADWRGGRFTAASAGHVTVYRLVGGKA
jgi:hypothetical protein